ncbi:hypothetical protein [Bacillus pumilus]|uniref:hypothetical protein n=1 Tax=Bacillus pumilus TaxID=1408 RepID=UPI0007EE9E86|nr:hypothetical protein [Bacillus pumilus]MCW4679963.1 hypothetical protein [Bacillus pumilus]OBS84089.1 hypothetical protein BAY68_13295 [Bacillus pumilus]
MMNVRIIDDEFTEISTQLVDIKKVDNFIRLIEKYGVANLDGDKYKYESAIYLPLENVFEIRVWPIEE